MNSVLIEEQNQIERLENSLVKLREIFRNHQIYIKDNFKISELEMEIIQYVATTGPKKMKQIGDNFNIKLSTLTSIIDKIEKQKFLTRVNSKTDRRSILLELTKKGKEMQSKYSHYIHVMALLMKRTISPDNFDDFVNEIEKISEKML